MADVRLTSLVKRYGDNEVVRGLDLHVRDGEIVCLLGPSGCGKTTTLRMVAGLERPTAGEVSIGDRPVSSAGLFVPPEERRLGMVFQSYAVFPHMSVEKNVAYGLKKEGLGNREIDEQVREMLEQVQLTKFAKRKPHQLSGGQRQRLGVARSSRGTSRPRHTAP